METGLRSGGEIMILMLERLGIAMLRRIVPDVTASAAPCSVSRLDGVPAAGVAAA
jgi:hypothetical protein